MEIRLNSDLRFWGYTEPDYSQDLSTVVVPVSRGEHTEQFTISGDANDDGVNLIFNWSNSQWELPIEKQ